MGLLCHLKEDQTRLHQAWNEMTKGSTSTDKVPCPTPDKLPAMSAVIQDPNLFHVLLSFLRASTDGGSNTVVASGTEDQQTKTLSQPQSFGPPSSFNRKRSLSFVSSDQESSKKLIKLQHSPAPGGKLRYQHEQTEPSSGTKESVQLNFRLLSATILFSAFEHLDHWPAQLVRAYAEDCFGPRSWVDDDRCMLLTSNLARTHAQSREDRNDPVASGDADKVAQFYAVFQPGFDDFGSAGVERPSVRQVTSASLEKHGSGAVKVSVETIDLENRTTSNSDSDSGDEEECIISSDPTRRVSEASDGSSSSSGDDDVEIVESTNSFFDDSPSTGKSGTSPVSPAPLNRPPFPFVQKFINVQRVRLRYFGRNLINAHQAIGEALSDRLATKSKQNSKLLLSLPSFACIPEVRCLSARNLERWLQSPALSAQARTLFSSIVNQMENVDPPLPEDKEAIEQILGMRLKANQLNMHLENITAIANQIPTATVARLLFLRLLREELENMEGPGLQSMSNSAVSNHLRMLTAISSGITADLASDGIAEAFLTLLANQGEGAQEYGTRGERHHLVLKMRRLIRSLSSILGPSQFDGCRLAESFLSFDVDNISWTVEDEEDKGRLMFECVSLIVGDPPGYTTESNGQRKVAQRMNERESGLSNTATDTTVLRDKLLRARKLMLTWCCYDYAKLCSASRSPSLSRLRGQSTQTVSEGAGTPDFSSVLDGRSNYKESLTGLNVMRCVLFMAEAESLVMYSFLHPGDAPGSIDDRELQEERYRIEQCRRYGVNLDDEIVRIPLESTKHSESGMDRKMALSLLEDLFACCGREKEVLRISNSKLIWEMYELVEYRPGPLKESSKESDSENEGEGECNEIVDLNAAKQERSTGGDRPKPPKIAEELIPTLAYPGMWWRVTAVALILCGASPDKIGIDMWNSHPTLQALMKMVTSNRYRFPTVDCDDERQREMRSFENELREKEATVAENLFLPPMPKRKKSTINTEVRSAYESRGTRVSARQREKQEKILRQKREKEEAKAMEEYRKRKRQLRSAQKSIMILDPKSAARKPPRQSVDLILSVERMFRLSRTFQQSISPDFVLMTIGDTSRESVERAYDWLIPIISALPDIINRLPSSAACFLLLRAYGAEGGKSAELRELSAPLLVHVKESLAGKFGMDDAVRAIDLLFGDVSDSHPDRRRCARRVLREALSSFGGLSEENSVDLEWLTNVLNLQHAQSIVSLCIKHVSQGLAHERGSVLRSFVLALDQYIQYAQQQGVKGSWDFASMLCSLVTNRHNVCADALNRFAEFRSVAMSVVCREIKTAYTSGKLDAEPEEPVHIKSCPIREDDIGSEENHKSRTIILPFTLLYSACVLLSIWKKDCIEEEDSCPNQAAVDVLNSLLCSRDRMEDDENGLGSATYARSGEKAVTEDLWVMLVKSRSEFVSGRTVRSAPLAVLPRLLLCSGLSRSSLFHMIDRLGEAGEKSDDESKVFSQFLATSARSVRALSTSAGRELIARKLLGRFSVYLGSSNESNDFAFKKNFLVWLSAECGRLDQSIPSQKKNSQKRSHLSSGHVVNLPRLRSTFSHLVESDDAEDDCTKDSIRYDDDEPDSFWADVSALGPTSRTASLVEKSMVNPALRGIQRTDYVVLFKHWLSRNRLNFKLIDDEMDQVNAAKDSTELSILLLDTFARRSAEATVEHLILTWVPLLTKATGAKRLWEIMFGDELAYSQDLLERLTSRCAVVWEDHHISECCLWILCVDADLRSFCPSRAVTFIVLTAREPSIHAQVCSKGMYGAPPTTATNSVTAAAKLAISSAKRSNWRVEPGRELNSRNALPDWLVLLLFLARDGQQQMNLVTTAMLAEVPEKKGAARGVLSSALLRLYTYFPRSMNLGNPVLRTILSETAAEHSSQFLVWRSPLDEQIGNMISTLQVNQHQRLVQSLSELCKDHPLLILRKLSDVVSILENDGRADRQVAGSPEKRQARISGRMVQVSVRHWGYSYNDYLWIAVLDLLSTLPQQILFTCGLRMGVLDLLGVYVRLVYTQSQLREPDKISRLQERLSDFLASFRAANAVEWDQWCSSTIAGLTKQGLAGEMASRMNFLPPSVNAG